MTDSSASSTRRSRRANRPHALVVTDLPNPDTNRQHIVNYSSPLNRQPRDRSTGSSGTKHSRSYESFSEAEKSPMTWAEYTPPRAPSPARTNEGKSIDKNQRRPSIDLFQAAWNRSNSTLAPHHGGSSLPEPHMWDSATYKTLTQPAVSYEPGSAAIGHNMTDASTDQLIDLDRGVEGILSSVTLADGRVVDKDRASGQWRWRDSATTMHDDYAHLRSKRNSTVSKYSTSTTMKETTQTPPPPIPPLNKELYETTALPPPPPTEDQDLFTNSSLPHEIAFVILVCLAQFLALAGLSQTVSPLPIIGKTFNITDPGTLSWYTASFSLSVGTFILPAGRVGDMLGHKRVYVLGWIWYSVWSLITGFTFKSSSVVFTVCRAFQGMGPAFLVPNAMALIGITFPVGKKRNIIFAIFGSMGPTGFTLGSVISSAVAQKAWWPWMFWIQAMVCAGIAGVTFLLIPAKTKQSDQTITGRFDFPGAVTGVAGLVLINFAFNQAPLSGWQDLYIPVLLVVGLGVMGVFIFVELKIAPTPLIPLKSLSKEGAFALACIGCGWGSHGIWLYYFFLFAENVRGHSPLDAASQLVPAAIIGVCFALSTGFLVKRIKVAYIMFTAMCGFMVGLIFLTNAPIGQTYWALTFVSVLITPLGMNLSFPSGTILLSNAMPRQHQGVAASLIATMVNYSISTGLGMAGSIDKYVTAAHTTKGQTPTPSQILTGYRAAWDFGIALDVLGILISGYFCWRTWRARSS